MKGKLCLWSKDKFKKNDGNDRIASYFYSFYLKNHGSCVLN